MKKDRNSFFEGSSMNAFSGPTPFNTQAQASQSFYANAGMPQMPMNQMPMNQMPMNQMPMNQMPMNQMPMNQMPMNQMPMNQMPMCNPESNLNELESRMAKLERSINRLDSRLSKLEGTTYYSNETYENTTNQGMYMV